MDKTLQSYFRRLTEFSGHNGSLQLSHLPSSHFLDICLLEKDLGMSPFRTLNNLISRKDDIAVIPFTSPLAPAIKSIYRTEQSIFHEMGARDLFVGWPFVTGRFQDGTRVRTPLVFFPVTVEKDQKQWVVKRRKDVNVTFNKFLLFAFAHFNKTRIEEMLTEAVLNDLDRDSTLFRTKLYQLLKNSSLGVKFDQENFIDRLMPFEDDPKHDGKDLNTVPQAVLGVFPQSDSYLIPDYTRLMKDLGTDKISQLFEGVTRPQKMVAVRYSDRVTEETTFTPFPMDSYQEKALNLAKEGYSVTVKGPPGTGKSQLICNLISDFAARGKSVLVVSQKKATLDLLYNRLKTFELQKFVGLFHDYKNDRKNVYEQILRQIASISEYRQRNNNVDYPAVIKAFQLSSEKISELCEALDEYKDALFDESECGKSPKELYLISNPNKPYIQFNQIYRKFPFPRVKEFIGLLENYLQYHHRFITPHHFWSEAPSYAGFKPGAQEKILDIIKEVPLFQEKIMSDSGDFAARKIDFETAIFFASKKHELNMLKNNLDNDQVFRYYQHLSKNPPEGLDEELARMEQVLLQCFQNEGMETTLTSGELGKFQEALEVAVNFQKGPFKSFKWKILADEKDFVTQVMKANGLKANRQGLEKLLDKIDNRLNFEHVVSQIHESRWLTDFPENSYKKTEIRNWFFFQKSALKAWQLSAGIAPLKTYIPLQGSTRHDYNQKLEYLLQFLDKVIAQMDAWKNYLSEIQIRRLLLKKGDRERAEQQLKEDFDDLVKFHDLRAELSQEDHKVISELIQMETEKQGPAIDIFINSISLAWIDHIEQKYPVLKDISSSRIDQLAKDLQEEIEIKRGISLEAVLFKLREGTYGGTENQSTPDRYRDLHEQTSGKGVTWPIRKLISHFTEEVSTLLPCWLTTPQSASSIFPMEKLFDLVIVDEASQLAAEKCLPAIYRGRAVVVIGDDQQLPPHDHYGTIRTYEGDKKEIPSESILDLARNHTERVLLRTHYRSQSMDLIDFSNHHFYQDRLKVYPDFRRVRKNTKGIQYLKVPGEWKDKTNPTEAAQVIKVLSKLSGKRPGKSCGVITFSEKQRDLIMDLVEEQVDNKKLILPHSFFVKTAENTQGDEIDITILSTGFVKLKNENLTSQDEFLDPVFVKKLNVAITRSTEEIYLITSLIPDDLKNIEAPGVLIFRTYLEYAEAVSTRKWLPYQGIQPPRNKEWYLKNLIADLTPKNKELLDRSLSFADIVIKNSKEYFGMVLTDDELFYDTQSAKEAHYYRYNLLREKNWPYVEFSSREFWLNQKRAFNKLGKFISRITDFDG